MRDDGVAVTTARWIAAARPIVAALAAVAVIAAAASPAFADDVTAHVSAGKLTIKGDADGNTIALDHTGLGPMQVRVTGTGTTINGLPGPLVFDGVTALVIDMGAGDDTLTV